MTAGAHSFVNLYERLRKSWSIDTGSPWRPDSPASGQCGVTALVVQDLLGGKILKTDVNGSWHFYNMIDGKRIDFTMSQFETPICYDDLLSCREEAFNDASPGQYELLGQRLRETGAE
jgi:hypothetical protein